MDEKSFEDIRVISIENFVQQILLVLIQNAKESLNALDLQGKEAFHKKMIHIVVTLEYGKVIIDISDWGGGISKEVQETLFSEFKISKKYQGSGIGLYFAKKLAKEKLLGDLVLYNASSPTTFRLIFPQYISKKE